MDPKIILETALNREEISAIEALLLLQGGPPLLPDLYGIADTLNRRFNEEVVSFVRGKKIHYTNICRAECSFCTFRRSPDQKGAFTLTPDQVVRQIREAHGIRQVTLEGGLNPDLNLAWYVGLIARVRREFPKLHIQAYSPSEIYFIAKRARTTYYDVLKRLRDAGLDSLPGDSADILNDKVRKKICPEKLRTHDWVETVKTAHRLGITTTASILFGHVEDEIHICEHLEIIKTIQKETGGFTSFEPVPFLPNGAALARNKKVKTPASLQSTKTMIAIARLFFGRAVINIRVDWTKVGSASLPDLIAAGANDLGTLMVDPHEIRSPETNGRLQIPATTLRSLLSRTGRTLEERPPHRHRALVPAGMRREEPILV